MGTNDTMLAMGLVPYGNDLYADGPSLRYGRQLGLSLVPKAVTYTKGVFFKLHIVVLDYERESL
jgi:hypothetical protein